MLEQGLTPTYQLKPQIYKLVSMKTDKLTKETTGKGFQWVYEKYLDEFPMPSKIYGDFEERATYFFNYYRLNNGSMGCCFVGSAGAGKTLISELICNIAIKHNMPVVHIPSNTENSSYDAEFKYVEPLSELRNCVVYIDEFGKVFSNWDQRKFLTLLTNKFTNILWVLTENSLSSLNRYILNRPGRIRYLKEFNKIPREVVLEYLQDYPVSSTFKENLLDKHFTSSEFTFDHLAALVSEHKHRPHLLVDDLCEDLNIKHMLTKYKLVCIGVKYLNYDLDKFAYNVSIEIEDVRGGYSDEKEITLSKYTHLLTTPSDINIRFNLNSSYLIPNPNSEDEIRKLLELEEEGKKSFQFLFNNDKPTYEKYLREFQRKVETNETGYRVIVFKNDYLKISFGLFDVKGNQM